MAENKVVCLHSISLRGFKSFKEKAKIGPLTGFSCIVGPNGAGKSVVGEALAFAFGGLTRTMRARNAAGLLNDHLKKQGTSTSAKVSVTLLLTSQKPIKVSRLLTGTRSQYFLKADGIRRELQLHALKEELALLGIDVSASDRFLVMQNHQVVKAKHPLELSKHLEWLTGAGHYEERINEMDEKISKFTSEYNTLQDCLSEVQVRRQKLAPVVERWQKFNREWQDFAQKKMTFLRRQEKLLRDQLKSHLTEEEQLSTENRKVEQKRDRIEVALSEMKSKQKELEYMLRENSKITSAAAKKKECYRLQVVKSKVRLEEARKESSRQKSLQESEAADLMKQKHLIEDELRINDKELLELANQTVNLEISTGMESSIQQTLSKAQAEHQHLLSRIARVQEMMEDADEHKAKYASRTSELKTEVNKLRDEISKCTIMVEKQQLERQSFETKMEYLQHEIHQSNTQTLPGIKGQFAAVQLRIKKYMKVQDLKSESGKGSREDEAANFLKGRLQCRLLGRLADLAAVQKDTVVAVNAVLCHLVNMATTFVTEDRVAANEVISYFQANRISVATCEILSESANSGANQYSDPRSLLRYIQCKDSIRSIFTKYLRDWLVVPDRNAAVSYFRQRNYQLDRGNIVTLSGDIFKQDGEIIRAQSNRHDRHLLRAVNTEMGDAFSAEPVEIEELNIKDLLHQKSVLEAKIVAEEEKLAEYLKEERTLQEQLQLSAQNESAILCSLAILQAKLKNKVSEASSTEVSLQKVISHDGLRNELAQLLVCKQDHERSLSELRASLSPGELEKDDASRVKMQVKSKTSRRNQLRKRLDYIVSQLSSDFLHEEINLAPLEKALNEGKMQLDEGAVEYAKRASELEATKQDLSLVEENINIHSRKATIIKKKQALIASKLEELMALKGSIKSNLEKVLNALSESSDAQICKRTCLNENDMEDNSFYDEGEYLAQEEKLLMEERRTIDACALEEDVVCKKKESSLAEEMKVLTELLKTETLLKDELETKRFSAFREAMVKVNDCLSKIYRSLTKHGDAYLTYTEDKSLLFADGVHFHVRPDRHKWRNFSSLSGGQQALAGLALSFSLQLAYPSPFYFFDEIDASLDTKNARLVAEYIQSMASAQYILVSHRPQLYELASTLVGIYHFHDGSACITVTPTNKAQ